MADDDLITEALASLGPSPNAGWPRHIRRLCEALTESRAENARMRQAFHDAYVLLVHALAHCDNDPDVRPQLRRAQQVCSDQIEWIEFGTEAMP